MEFQSIRIFVANIVDYTYKFVNKDGGSDRRFSDNPKIPICEYSEYRFFADGVIDVTIRPSKSNAMHNFVDLLRSIGEWQKN